jgi:hypothetical protein
VDANAHLDDALLWSLHEIADAARDVPFEQQPERLRRALERVFVAAPMDAGDYPAGTSNCST